MNLPVFSIVLEFSNTKFEGVKILVSMESKSF